MAVLCPEKLPQCDLPQLASCLQRLSVDVLDHHQHHLVEAVGGDRVSVPGDCLPLPWPGPQVQTVLQLSKYFLISKYFLTDHRGTNNSYQIKSSNNLARLYSTSTMEHHHFDQCLMLLSSNGNQLLTNVSKVIKSVYLILSRVFIWQITNKKAHQHGLKMIH